MLNKENMPSSETRRAIERAMMQHPRLTSFGFGIFRRRNEPNYEQAFADQREEMLSDKYCRQFEDAVAWLQLCGRTKGVNRRQSTYGLKHEVEDWARHYISNGMLIAAAIHLGFKVQPTVPGDDCPNAYINISNKHRPRPVAQEAALHGG